MLQASIRLGRLAGIPVGLHYSWFIIAALITLSLAAHFQAIHGGWGGVRIWSVALVTALLFFATLLAHELSHAVVARAHGLPVRSITLFALGGVAQIEREARSAATEFQVAIAGPLVSIGIGALCLAGAAALGWPDGDEVGVLGTVLGWLGSINVVLALFNLIPGYPLDGGRILRAILWGIYKDGARATRVAARTGQVAAGGFILIGLVQFFGGAGLGGLWLAFIGWFLLEASGASYAQVAITESLRGVGVGDIMAREWPTLEAATTLQAFVDDVLLKAGRRSFLVVEDGRTVGLMTAHEVRAVDRARWPSTRVADVMRPLDALRTVRPDSPATDALRIMAQDDVNQLPVVQDGRIVGVLTRGHIVELLQTRAALDQ